MIDFMVMFGQIELAPAFADYLDPLRERPAYLRAKELDAALKPAES